MLTKLFFGIALIVCLFISCEMHNRTIEHTEDLGVVSVIYAPSGLGDRGYNDNIYKGIQQGRILHGFRLENYLPNSIEQAEEYMKEWLNDEPGVKRLLIMASSDFEGFVKSHSSQIPDDGDNRVVLLESRINDQPFYTVYLPLYGAAYQAGVATMQLPGADKSLVLCANPFVESIHDATSGFIEGYSLYGGQQCDVLYLSDKHSEGFAAADHVYRMCYDLENEYGFIFPLIGGSSQGLLRFTREYPRSFYTASMDVDQSEYSNRVTYSVLKHTDRAILKILEQWVNDTPIPRNQRWGLESGMVKVSSAANYLDFFCDIFEFNRDEAILKETNYENEK